jgi:hypothetical protein
VKTRAAITVVWIVCFICAIVIVEAYFIRVTPSGVPLLLPSDRVAVYKILGLVYGANMSIILGAWYTKPFPKMERPEFVRFMTMLAILLTVVYNLLLLYLVGQGHFALDEPIGAILERTKTIGGALLFLVAPINLYYFGTAPKG